MKDFLKRLPKKLLSVFMVATILVAMSSTAFAAFGPDRPTKAWTPTVDGFDHVTFNSFTGVGNGVGDERDFFRGVQVGRDSVWSDPVQNVTQDSEVEGKIYIHNNADARLNDQAGNPGVAKNVNVKVALPTGVARTQQTTAYISADNAQPKQVFDTLDMTGANNGAFALDYVPGSAQLHKGGATSALSDSLVSSGVNLGDQKGCFDFVQEVTFRMKVKMPQYTIKKSVRFEGQTSSDWKEAVNAKPGQTVEWKLEFDNVGRTLLNNVVVLDQVPANLTVVPGSVKLIDGNFPNGYAYKDSEAIQNNGTQVNVNIGNVNPGINSIVAFKTKINDVEATRCGNSQLVNTAYATPQGFSTVKDTAEVDVTGANQNCTPVTPATPTALVNTGPGDVAAIFAAATVAGAVAYRVYMTRRLSRQ
jgi:uncharacterized repeat protein (TIGR01451 family)